MVWTMRETMTTACPLSCLNSWQLSGSSFTSVINPLFPRWPQCISAPWNQRKLSTFHSAIIFADLPQSSVSYQVPERRRDGASNSFKSHWKVAGLISRFSAAVFCLLTISQGSCQANKLHSLQSPQFNWWGRQHPEHSTESRRHPGSLKIYFTRIKILESEKVIHNKVNMQFLFKFWDCIPRGKESQTKYF